MEDQPNTDDLPETNSAGEAPPPPTADVLEVMREQDDIKVLRRSGGGLVEYRFDYPAYLKGHAPHTNMLLQTGDTVVVPD